ncbi:HAD family hydrolase [Halobacterium salinarum]|uniref:HAD family hydrolase n=1 Tax=Halobacterium salinarum TaxID=2242 RepID=UPI001F32EF03|nr:HAD family hydrolase [Halobacterium salinarum]MCF2206993.1 HAD family hydrolase [Halobacterium salinarum]
MSHEAVFVDLDNTLYPYQPCNEAGQQAAWETATDRGYDVSRAAFESLYSRARAAVKREVSETASAHDRGLYFKRAIELQAGTPNAADALALADAYWDAYIDALSLFDGVRETLDRLRDAGVDVAVVTNLTTRVQLRKLAATGLAGRVDCVLTSQEVGREKPASVMFTVPLARLGVAPADTVMVGDSVASDVVGANGVGLTSVLCNNDRTGLTGRESPDHRIESFRDVTDVVL